jgi:hypothetical protein
MSPLRRLNLAGEKEGSHRSTRERSKVDRGPSAGGLATRSRRPSREALAPADQAPGHRDPELRQHGGEDQDRRPPSSRLIRSGSLRRISAVQSFSINTNTANGTATLSTAPTAPTLATGAVRRFTDTPLMEK